MKPAVSPEQELINLYGSKEPDEDRVYVDTESTGVDVDGETVSVVNGACALESCCGVLELNGVSSIAPSKTAAFAAVDALRCQTAKEGGYASIMATVNAVNQKTALAFFRAVGWTEIPLGNSKTGQRLVMFLKVLRPS